MISDVFILAKNEESNIHRGLTAIATEGVRVTVLDSGSSDRTVELSTGLGARVEPFAYQDHCTSYNQLTRTCSPSQVIVIVDADIILSRAVLTEIDAAFSGNPELQAVLAPVQMFWEGIPLKYSSLYPPKPIAFRGGGEYFEPVGHGERLKHTVIVHTTTHRIVHDDRKDYAQVLQTQVRYARQLLRRSRRRELTGRDRWRVRSPLLLFATPLYSYVFRLGFLDGRAGLVYALDRLIAEALAFRTAISPLANADEEQKPPQRP